MAMPEKVSPRIVAVKTVVPQHKLGQADFKAFGDRIFRSSLPRLDDLLQVYDTAGIETRYISVPLSFLENERSFEEKNEAYVQTAVPLLEEAAAGCLAAAGLEAAEIDTIILVSTTGIAVPTLDVRLMEVLPFRRDVRRLPLFGFGCAGRRARPRAGRDVCSGRTGEPCAVSGRRALQPHPSVMATAR